MKRALAAATAATVLIVLIALSIAGCTQTANEKVSTLPAPAGTSGGTAEKKATTDQAGAPATQTVPQTPIMIKTANISIEVGKGEFEKKFEQAALVAVQVGGYVTMSETTRQKGELSSGTVTLRVPADKFDEAIKRVKKLGKVEKASTGGEDVSEEYVDLQSRLKNYKAQEDALILLMAKAQSVQDTLAVQQQLTSVQEQIEIITGRLNYLQNRADYSTINVTVEEPGAIVPATDEWGFITALRTAARAFLWTINAIIVILGAIAPVLIIIAGLYFLIRWLIRRRYA